MDHNRKDHVFDTSKLQVNERNDILAQMTGHAILDDMQRERALGSYEFYSPEISSEFAVRRHVFVTYCSVVATDESF